jgi:predicted ABC-type ATPase
MLREKFPELADNLRRTSPRWGWRSGDMPTGVASPGMNAPDPALATPDMPDRADRDEMLTEFMKESPGWVAQSWGEELDRVSMTRKAYQQSRAPRPEWYGGVGYDAADDPGDLSPDPEFDGEVPLDKEDEFMAWMASQRQAAADWDDSMAELLHMGVITPEYAKERGYSEAGVSVGVSFNEEQYKPLPERLFHVTTAADEVAKSGLKTRKEVGRSALGGGPDNRISLSDSEEFAENFAFIMGEASRAVRGELTVEEMMRQAREGEGADEPWLGEGEKGTLTPYLEIDLRLDEERPIDDLIEREARGEISADDRWRIYKAWMNYRSRVGGPEDPLFFFTTADDVLAVDPDQIKIAEVRPVGSHITGVQLRGTDGEWRIPSGSGVRVRSFRDGRIEQPNPSRAEAGMASPEAVTRALAGDPSGLPEPSPETRAFQERFDPRGTPVPFDGSRAEAATRALTGDPSALPEPSPEAQAFQSKTEAITRSLLGGMLSPGVETPEAQAEAIDVGGDVQRAADLLAAGYRVQIDQPRTVSILLGELNRRVQAAIESGDSPPDFDVCDIYLPGTNIFCAESQGIPRSQMPQLSGVPAPGSRADRELPKNDKGEVDLSELFRQSLEEEGIEVADDVTPSAFLRATQSELNGAKVSGIANAMMNGVKIEGSPLFISSDDYIVDGHHRWAANVGVDAQDGELGDVPQEVQRIDLPITEILGRANAFAEEWGIPQAGVADNRALATKILSDRGELPEGGMASPVEIGGTPFRPEDADDPEGFQRKMEDYQRRMAEAADALGVQEMSNMEQQGIWLSEENGQVVATPEPSVATDLGDADMDTALAAAAIVGQFYEQDGMAVFNYDPEAPGGRFAVSIPEGMDDDEILTSITEGMAGGAGASIMDGTAYFYASDFDEGLQLADQLAERLGSDAQAQRGTFTLVSDEYGDISYEQALRGATDQAGALSARWRMEDGQNRGPSPDANSGSGDVPEAEAGAGDAGAVAREPAMASPDPDFPPGGGTEPSQFTAIPGSDAETIFVGDDVQRAADLLAAGYKVELDQPRTVSTLLDELDRRVKEAIEKGEDAPNINICDISVPKTNLFCAESKGIPRNQMPQLSGIPVPGSRADDLPKNDKGEVDLSDLFRERLAAEGIGITDETEGAAYLRATQSELNGPKVAGIAGAMLRGVEIGGSPLFVSSDDYIVDGHHRWAAMVGVDSADGELGDVSLDIQRVDMPILELLDRANRFAEEMGIPQAGMEENRALAKQMLEQRGELPEDGMASPAAATLLEYYDFGPDSPFWQLPVGDRLRLVRAIGMNDWPVPSDDTINNILGGARSTQERFAEVIPETGVATYSPERRQLHSEIIGRSVAGGVSELLGENHSITTKLREGGIDALTEEDRQFIREAAAVARGDQKPTALFMAGGAASGKTSALNAQPDLRPPSAVSVNADDVKEKLPEFNQQKDAGERAAAVTTHKESSDVAKMTSAVTLDLGLNVVVDGTGNKSIEDFRGRLTKMRDAGYEIDLLVVSLPTDEAVVRATTRATTEGRWVPEPEIRKAHRQVSRNLDALKGEGFVRRISIVDNSQPFGEPPTEVARVQGGGELEVLNQDLLDMFWGKMNEPDFDPNDIEAYETTVGLTEAAVEDDDERAERVGGKTPPTEWVTYPSNDWVEFLGQAPQSITPDGWLLDEAQNKIRMLTPEEMEKHGITGAVSPTK